ncbi:EF-hand calcium-binding domain-containing protein 14 [Anabarilius grahami]|uniref:EF-hand calcium-binding domain-containing protein 14 n=1 Tax=Anabarilius grahami TaxID=495550 RepID=A0A3N0Z8V5_ANAGA|nr:EF-hand calcium-binding domain-containing protein 14 [Anabarilius grahami]
MSPQKKMKKRKELNALIGLSDSSRRKSKHRLLRTEPPESESESGSEEQEFSGGRTGLFGKEIFINILTDRGSIMAVNGISEDELKKVSPSIINTLHTAPGVNEGLLRRSDAFVSSVQCCSLCYPLCVFILLAACVMACAGLIWMQIALKEDLDSMKEKIRTMESSQKLSSHEILKLSEELKAKQMKLDDMESGERGLTRLWSNLTEVNQKLSALDSAVNHLKANIKSASDLIALPRSVEELQKSVASIGSTVTSLQHDVTLIQAVVEERRTGADQLKDSTISVCCCKSDCVHVSLFYMACLHFLTIKNGVKPVNDSSWAALKQDVQDLQDGVSEVNGSLLLHQSWCREQIQSVHFMLSNLSRWVSVLERSESGDTQWTAPAGHQLQTDTGSPPPRRPRAVSRRRFRRGPPPSSRTESVTGA